MTENSGVFVTRARSLVSLAPKGNLIKTGDLSKMNPSMMGGGMVGSGMIGRGPRDRLIGTQVMIIKGPSKGVAGVIKDTNGTLARVELLTGNKVISIDKSKLKRRRYVVCSCFSFETHRKLLLGRTELWKTWIASRRAETCDHLQSTLMQLRERPLGRLLLGRAV